MHRSYGSIAVQTVTDATGRTLALIHLTAQPDRTGILLTRSRMEELGAAIESASEDALALTGRRGTFSIGADLTALREAPMREVEKTLQAGQAALRTLARSSKPTFAFVNGVALGGGLELAMHCEHRYVATSARQLGLPEVSNGALPAWGATVVLPRIVGKSAAMRLIVDRSARGASHKELTDLGLFEKAIEGPSFLDSALQLAFRTLRGDPVVRSINPTSASSHGTLISRRRRAITTRAAGESLRNVVDRLIELSDLVSYEEAMHAAGQSLLAIASNTNAETE